MLLNRSRYRWLIPLSLTIAFFWQFWPLPPLARQVAPDAIVAVLLYWATQRPEQVSGGWAFIVGLLRDSAEGAPLGTHALALVLVVYLVQLLSHFIRQLAIWQQSIAVMVLHIFYTLIGNWALLLASHPALPLFPIAAVATGICWPACYWILSLMENGYWRPPTRS